MAGPWEDFQAVKEPPPPWTDFAAGQEEEESKPWQLYEPPVHLGTFTKDWKIAPTSWAGRLLGGPDAFAKTDEDLAQGKVPEVKALRPSWSLPLAKALDAAANHATGGRSGPSTLTDLLEQSTREPGPEDRLLPRIPQQEGHGAQLAAGAINIPLDFAEFSLSPEGVALGFGLGSAPKALQRIVGGIFSEEGIRHGLAAPTLQEKMTGVGGGVLIGTGTAADFLVRPSEAKPAPPPPPQPVRIPRPIGGDFIPEQVPPIAPPEPVAAPVEPVTGPAPPQPGPGPATAPAPEPIPPVESQLPEQTSSETITPPAIEQTQRAIAEREEMLAGSLDPAERQAIAQEIVGLRSNLEELQRSHDEAQAFENAWRVIPQGTRERMALDLRSRGIPEETIASMTPEQARAELARPAQEEPRAPGREPGEEEPLSEEEQARADYYRELQEQMEEPQAGQGKEFIEAVLDAGGFPSKNNPARKLFRGELDRLEEEVRDPLRKSSDLSAVKLFSKTAGGLDRLAVSLRDQGFNVEGPDDVLALFRQRLTTGKPIYGLPELASVMEEPPPFHKLGPTSGIENPREGRWRAIENTYMAAKAAQDAVPGVPLKDIFAIYLRDKTQGRPGAHPIIAVKYVDRANYPQFSRDLEREFPSDKFSSSVQSGHEPYRPRKGEPSYREWLKGARPDFTQRKGELFPPAETPFNLKGQQLTEEIGAEGEARAKAEASAKEKTEQLRLLEPAGKYGQLPDVTIHTNGERLTNHVEHAKAKQGSIRSARSLVRSLAKPEKIQELARAHPAAIVVYPHAEETRGRNKIPVAMAREFEKAGLSVEPRIIQTNKAAHTESSMMERMLLPPEFEGPVKPGGPYVLLDDMTTSGGTLRSLQRYIEGNGGKVVAVHSLATRFGQRLGPTRPELKALRGKFDVRKLNTILRTYGIANRIEELTGPEVRYLSQFSSEQAIVDKIGRSIDSLADRRLAPGLGERAGRVPAAGPGRVREEVAAAREMPSLQYDLEEIKRLQGALDQSVAPTANLREIRANRDLLLRQIRNLTELEEGERSIKWEDSTDLAAAKSLLEQPELTWAKAIAAGQAARRQDILDRIHDNEPVPREAVEALNLDLPNNYIPVQDRYVFQTEQERAQIKDYLDSIEVPPDKQKEAINGITGTLSLASDPTLAVDYETLAKKLRDPGGAGVVKKPPPDPLTDKRTKIYKAARTNRQGLEALLRGDPAALNQALTENKNRVSTIVPELVSGKTPVWNIKDSIIRTPADLMMAVQTIRSPYKESVKVVLLDANNRVIFSEIVSVGSLNESIAHPREIFRQAMIYEAKRVMISHNHPSGDPTPSMTDHQLQRRLKQVAEMFNLDLVDHVITNGKKYYSFAQDHVGELEQTKLQPWELATESEMPQLDSPEKVNKYITTLRASDPNSAHIIYVGTRLNIKAIERVPDATSSYSLLKRQVLRGVSREGAYAVFLDLPGGGEGVSPVRAMRGISEALDVYFTQLLDATWPGMESANQAGLLVREEPPEKRSIVHAMAAGGAAHRTPPRLPAPPPPPSSPIVAAAAGPVANWWRARTIGIRKVIAPQTIDAPARMTANIIRDYNGHLANRIIQADHALAQARADFDRTPVPKSWKYDPSQPLPRNYAFIDNSERGGANLSPADRQLKGQIDKMFGEAVDEVHRVAPTKLPSLIQDYFPHIWEDPEQAKRVFAEIVSKRPLEGTKGFLKQRVIEYTIDGLKAGLRPVSDNPIDMSLTKLHEIHRFVAAQDILAEAKAIGARKFVYIFEKPPEGWIKLDDPTTTVHGPPFVTVPEAFDAQMRAKTVELLQKLGVPHERLVSLGGQRWGEAEKSGIPAGRIRTKFAGPLSVYWHELGHVLQFRYGWLDQIAYDAKRPNLSGKSETEKQLRALADLRIPQTGSTPGFKKYVRTKDEKAAVILEAYIHAPERMKAVAPNIFSRVEKFIANHPELAGIKEIKPNLVLGSMKEQIPVNGMVTLGHYYMPEGAAQVLHNYLSPGLQRFGVIRALRQSTNILSGLQLGFSAFHAGFTSIDAAVSTFALGLRYISEGKIGKGASRIIGSPLAPVANYYTGKAIQTAMVDPLWGGKVRILGFERQLRPAAIAGVEEIGRLAVQAGLRATADPFWRTQITRNLVRAWHEGGTKAFTGTVLRVPFAISEQMMRPILEYLVPRQKLGVFAGMAAQHMERLGPNADIHQVRDALARAADATEDRMGQMTYDNLFYNRVVRDTALLGFRAYGWTYGKYRALFGGISDTLQTPGRVRSGGPAVTDRMAYLVALPLFVAGVGSMMNYLMTGQPPQDWRDALMPRTGRLDRHGNPQRLSLPTYVKDILSDWHDFPNIKKMLVSFSHKLNPWLDVAGDIINNADFYGTKIYSEEDPFIKRQLDKVLFVLKSATPFSVTSAVKLKESDPSLMQEILPFFGFVPAKRELTMTPAQVRAAELFYDMLPRGARTPDQAEQARLVAKLMRDMKEQDPKWQGNLQEMLTAGKIRPAQLTRLFSSLPLNPLQYQVKKLGANEAMKVWDLASPAEREQLRPIVIQKLANSKTLSPEDRARYLRVMMADLAGGKP